MAVAKYLYSASDLSYIATANCTSTMKLNNRYILAAVSVLVVAVMIYTFSEIVSYILVAWVLSMIGAPVVKFLRKYLGKNLAAGITLGLFALLFTLLIWIFIPPLSVQARNLAGIDYTKVINSLEEPISDWESWLSDKGLMALPTQEELVESLPSQNQFVHTELVDIDSLLATKATGKDSIGNQNITLLIKIDGSNMDNALVADSGSVTTDEDSFFERLRKNLYTFLDPTRIPKLFSSIIGTLGSFIVGLFSVLFIAFFFLKEQGLFNNIVSSIIPDEYEAQSVQAITQTSELLIRYFTGVLGQMTTITIFVSILLSILGVKNALLIGFFAALMNVIPYVGPIIGAGFAIIITISSNIGVSFYDEMVPLMLKVLAVFGIMQMLDNFILQPNIFSKSVKAHPLEIFIIVLVGAKLGGIGGMVLAIPVYTVLRVIGKVFLSEFKVVQRITKGL